MNTTKKNKRNNNKGFTLGEIITTVAIIGTITSLALPNYLRMKMNTNEEMVRQQMRIVGEKMVEIMGKEGLFPDSEEWPNLVGGEDELSLTASLSAIDSLCYTNDEYSTNQSRSTYIFCSRPKTDACGKYAGKKRFCVHFDPIMSTQFSTGVVGETDMWDGQGAKKLPGVGFSGNRLLGELLTAEDLTQAEKTDILSDVLTGLAVDLYGRFVGELQRGYIESDCSQAPAEQKALCQNKNSTLSTYLALPEPLFTQFKNIYIPELYRQLESQNNITLYAAERARAELDSQDPNIVPDVWYQRGYSIYDFPDAKFLQIGFTLNNVAGPDEWLAGEGHPGSTINLMDWGMSTGRCEYVDCLDGYDGENNPYI
jgi:prepilin-type N-terminal cleavage/methylation domain-containing protein